MRGARRRRKPAKIVQLLPGGSVMPSQCPPLGRGLIPVGLSPKLRMKLRKFLVCAIAVGAIASVSVLQAQDQKKGRGGAGGRGMMSAEQRIERLEEGVGKLTDDQKAKIKDIYAKAQAKMEGIAQEERREKGMEIMRESGQQVRAVLTAEQQKKYDEMMAQMRGGRGGGGERKRNN